MAYFHHFGSKITFFLCRFTYFCQLFEPNIGENNKVEHSKLAWSNGIMCQFEEKHNFLINSLICIYFFYEALKKSLIIYCTLYIKNENLKFLFKSLLLPWIVLRKVKKKTSKMILLM